MTDCTQVSGILLTTITLADRRAGARVTVSEFGLVRQSRKPSEMRGTLKCVRRSWDCLGMDLFWHLGAVRALRGRHEFVPVSDLWCLETLDTVTQRPRNLPSVEPILFDRAKTVSYFFIVPRTIHIDDCAIHSV